MSWLITGTIYFLIIAFGLLLVAALLAPFESLGWWAGWSKRWPDPLDLAQPIQQPLAALADQAACYIVYLSGVGNSGPKDFTPKELLFLDMLAAQIPGAAVIRDVFPYSPAGVALAGPRAFSRLWEWVLRAVRNPATSSVWQLIGMRNVLQVMVAADQRYGPVFAFGIARATLLSLLRHGYRPGSAVPIFLVGLSGGGAVAVGAAACLHRLLAVPVWVISIGGVLTSDPGILEVEQVFHLSGSSDRTQYLGQILFPGCWPIFPRSAWNRALAQDKRTVIDVGPMRHMRHGDYFSRSALLPNGESHLGHTVAVIGSVVAGVLAAT